MTDKDLAELQLAGRVQRLGLSSAELCTLFPEVKVSPESPRVVVTLDICAALSAEEVCQRLKLSDDDDAEGDDDDSEDGEEDDDGWPGWDDEEDSEDPDSEDPEDPDSEDEVVKRRPVPFQPPPTLWVGFKPRG